MSKRSRRHAGAPRTRELRSNSGARYDTGYGKPPRQHQFQPGQSGNPKGRPKGVKNTATLLCDILDRKVEVRTGTTVRKMSVREAILTRFAESALKGDTKSAAFLLQRYDALETVSPPSPETARRFTLSIFDQDGHEVEAGSTHRVDE